MRRYDALDSLRGICACMVVLYHFKPYSHFVDTNLIRHSFLFVDFFFVLSGFVIFEAYRERLREGFGLGRFVILRIGRLYPLHAFLLICFVVYEIAWANWLSRYSPDPRPAFTGGNSPSALLANVLLLNSFGLLSGTSWNYPAWSIGAEFWTYILFGLLIIWASRQWLPFILSIITAVGLLGVLLISNTTVATADATGFPRCVFGFALGALLSCSRRNFYIIGWRSSALEAGAVLASTLLVIFASGVAARIVAPFVFVVTVATFAEEKGLFSCLLVTAPFRKLGELSYSIYMVHILVILLCANAFSVAEKLCGHKLRTSVSVDGGNYLGIGLSPWQGDLAYLLQLALVILAACWTFRFVENPWRNYSRQLVDHMRTTVEMETVA